MSSVVEIEEAIGQLSAKEFGELEQWFAEQRNRKWDRQIEEDGQSGKLDFLLQEVEEHRPRKNATDR